MVGASAFAQTTPQLIPLSEAAPSPNLYRAVVISRTVQAVNYAHRGEATKVDFAGTTLMPLADGWARVENKRGNLAITAEFGNLQRPSAIGGEYLTYVLWAISPEGRPVNLGEVLVGSNHRSKLRTTTDLQSFALIVTAEPYYAVRQPSNVVVLENIVRADTLGTTEAVNAKYELMERGGYIPRAISSIQWLRMQNSLWNFLRRGTRYASRNPKARRNMPARAIVDAVRADEHRGQRGDGSALLPAGSDCHIASGCPDGGRRACRSREENRREAFGQRASGLE